MSSVPAPHSRARLYLLGCIVCALAAASGCSRPTPTPAIMADTFFYGHAYLDANGNGEIDEDDPGLKGALFDVALGSGMGNRGITNKEGRAWVIIPGGADKDDWPVRARMRPPPDTGYTLIGPAEIVLAYRETSADFLFAGPAGDE